MAVQQNSNVDHLGAVRDVNVPDPVDDQDAATKHYVDGLVTNAVTALPVPDSSWRGKHVVVVGVPDVLYICLNSAAGVLSWRVVASG